jgi:excisionase family DNA binding protein
MDLEGSPTVMRTRDLAILLDLSPDTVNDMARRGILKGYKSGNQWRFRKKDVERYVEREKSKGLTT